MEKERGGRGNGTELDESQGESNACAHGNKGKDFKVAHEAVRACVGQRGGKLGQPCGRQRPC